MRSWSGFSFNKKKKKADQEDEKYDKYGGTTFGRKNSTYFPVSKEEVGRKKRRMVVNLLLAMTLTEDVETELLWEVSRGFDLPLVIGEQFICKLSGKKFQSASYNDCLQFILTTLYKENHQFAINIYSTLMDKLDDDKKCELAYHGFDCKTRSWHFHEYKNCFVGKEAVSWIVDNGLCKTRAQAVYLGQYWMDRKYIKHVHEQQVFEDQKYFYIFNDRISFFNNINKGNHQKAMSMMIDQNDKQLQELQDLNLKQQQNINNMNMNYNPPQIGFNTSEYSEFTNFNNGSPPRLKETPSYSSRMKNLNYDKRIIETESPKKKHSFTLPTIFGGH